MPEPPSRYSGAQKALHWTMAALIVTQVAIAIAMTNLGEGPLTNNLYELHKSFGLTVLALALVRSRSGACAVRRPSSPCPTGSAAPRRSRMPTLYVLFILVPLIGWIATSYCCKPVKFFWTVPVSLPIPGRADHGGRRMDFPESTSASPSRFSRSWRFTSPARSSTTSSAATARCCACSRTEPHRGGSARRSRWPISQAAAPRRASSQSRIVLSATVPVSRTAAAVPCASSRISAASPRPRRQGLAALRTS